MMSEKEEKELPWTSQPRREYEPWRNRRQRTPRILYYRERVKKLIVAMTIWNILTFILTAFGLLALIYYIFKPGFLVNLEIFPDSRCKNYRTKVSPAQKHSQSIVFSSVKGEVTPLYRPTDFLPLEEADELCSKYDMLRWTDHSKPRKVYEFIYIDLTSPDYRNELHVHIGQRYHDVDYFILASTEDSFRVKKGDDLMNTLFEKLRPYRDKIITYVIQPATRAKDQTPKVLSRPCRHRIEPITSVDCDRRSMQGDTIHIHYNATLEDGTLIGSTYGREDIGLPISYTIGTGSMVGWDEGVRGMCVGEKRVITFPPELGYGGNATGAVPANSTLLFHTELVANLDEPGPTEDSGLPFLGRHVTDPLSYEHRAYTYNSMYQVLLHLTGAKKPSEGDIILISSPDQIATSRAMSILRNCDIPPKAITHCLTDDYHYQGRADQKITSQIATFYAGEQTVLPAEIHAFCPEFTGQ